LVRKRRAAAVTVIASAVIVAIVAFSAVAYMVLSYQPASSDTTSVSSATSSSAVTLTSSSQGAETTYTRPGSASETTNSSLGLKLTLSVNATTIPSQDSIGITASILNTLPTANNLTAASAWAVGGLSAGPCNSGNATNKLYYPVGIGVFKGTYGLNNISSAGSPLFVWAEISCIVQGVSVGAQYYALRSITSYSLLPGSDNGTYAGYYAVPGTPPPPVCNGGVCTYTGQTPLTLTKGVFPTRYSFQDSINAANGSGFYNSLHSSLPANYTLVAGDEWGQVTLLHFSVVASNSLPKVGSFLANGGGCAENNNPAPCTTSEFSQAFIFNCAAQAATASGCTTQVPSSGPWSATSYTITVRYPYAGQPGEPARDNCMFSVPGDTVSPYAYCFMVNATAFALSP
jgi:hypothetical protein